MRSNKHIRPNSIAVRLAPIAPIEREFAANFWPPTTPTTPQPQRKAEEPPTLLCALPVSPEGSAQNTSAAKRASKRSSTPSATFAGRKSHREHDENKVTTNNSDSDNNNINWPREAGWLSLWLNSPELLPKFSHIFAVSPANLPLLFS